jgi:adenylate cyclase
VKSRLDLAVSDLGPTELKNIAEPVRVYSLEVGKAAQAKPTKPTASTQRSISVLLGAGIVALVAIGGSAWYFLGANRPATVASNAPAVRTEAAHLSIVVLPFTNLSGDLSQNYFADGITENLTTALSRIRDSFVIARNTAFTFKGKNTDAKEISKELGVRYVLEGSVQRDRNRVRVNAQLIYGQTATHLWADQFDTAPTDLLQMQDEIVARLAYNLGYEFEKAEAHSALLSKSDPDAQDLAMQCGTAVRKVGYFGKEAETGYRLCEQALDIDPDNVLALTMLATKFFLPVMLRRSADPQADLTRAGELVPHALTIDSNYSFAHDQKGQVLRAGRRFEDAIVEYERALALDPNNALAYASMGETYNEIGHFEKAIDLLDKAIRLSPRDPSLFYWYYFKGYAHFALRQDDEAIEWARRSIAVNPNWSAPRAVLAAALALTGHEAEARDEEQRRSAVSLFKTIKATQAIAPLASADPRVRVAWDRFIEGARKAGTPEE